MSKHLVTFNGVNESGSTIVAKTVFPSGKAVEVDDEKIGQAILERLQRHPEFTVSPVAAPKPKAKSEPKPRPAVKRRTSPRGK